MACKFWETRVFCDRFVEQVVVDVREYLKGRPAEIEFKTLTDITGFRQIAVVQLYDTSEEYAPEEE